MEKLRKFLAGVEPDDLYDWTLDRMEGERVEPMLFHGKDVERPHEVVAEILSLSDDDLPAGKRESVVSALLEISRWSQGPWAGAARKRGPGTWDGTVAGVEREAWDGCGIEWIGVLTTIGWWAEVVERSTPPELKVMTKKMFKRALGYARAGSPDGWPVGKLASALAAYPGESLGMDWRELLGFPQSADLAFRRLSPYIGDAEALEALAAISRLVESDGWVVNVPMLIRWRWRAAGSGRATCSGDVG